MLKTLIACTVTAFFAAAAAAQLNYHEHWDSYAAGDNDPVYTAVWQLDGIHPEYPFVESGQTIWSPPNRLQVLSGATRGITNDLTDGISNVGLQPGNPEADGLEMQSGEFVIGAGTTRAGTADPLDPLNLILANFLHISTTNQRASIAAYVELSLGDVHAPVGAGALNPLAAPIPVLALGKLNSGYTATDDLGNETGNAGNVGIYFFNGQEWIRTDLGANAASGGAGYSRLYAEIGATQVNVREDRLGNFDGPLDRAYLGGFDTLSIRNINPAGFSGTAGIDEVILAGGIVVPEPTAIALLAMALPLLRRRK